MKKQNKRKIQLLSGLFDGKVLESSDFVRRRSECRTCNDAPAASAGFNFVSLI